MHGVSPGRGSVVLPRDVRGRWEPPVGGMEAGGNLGEPVVWEGLGLCVWKTVTTGSLEHLAWFVLSFTEALWQESLGTGLRVILLSPGATRTEVNDVLGTEEPTSGAPFQEPRQVVETAMRALDRRAPPSVVSGRLNRLMANAVRLLSRRRAVLVAASMTRTST